MLKIVLLVTGVAALLLSFIPSLRTEATPFLQHPDAIYLAILGLINLLFAPVLQSSHPTRPLQAGAAALLVLGVVLQALILLAPLPTIADQPAIVLPLLSLVLATALQLAGSLKPGKPVSRSASAPTALGGSQDSGNRETGTVKWFNTSKGFGFISRDSGEDIFVHFRAIRGEGHRILIEGQRVDFSVVQRDKGLQAEDVIASRR
ncbi:TPA: cold-shock protein [Pseudomonas aeruginosa]|nr:cold-shock protein [Pseudomonas aeruginosa]